MCVGLYCPALKKLLVELFTFYLFVLIHYSLSIKVLFYNVTSSPLNLFVRPKWEFISRLGGWSSQKCMCHFKKYGFA